MIKFILSFLTVFFFSTNGFCIQLQYKFSLQAEKLPLLHVELSFQAPDAHSTDLFLPHSWAGESDLYKIVIQLQSNDTGSTIEKTEDPWHYVLKHKPNADVILSYNLQQDPPGPVTSETKFRPIIDRDYIHSVGEGLFVIPTSEKNLQLTLDWSQLIASKWTIANSFGVNETIQNIKTSRDELQDGIYVAGDFRILKSEIQSRPIYLAIRGSYGTSEDRILSLSTQIIKSQRNFWNDQNFPFFLITLIPLQEIEITAGTALYNSFSMFFGAAPNFEERLEYLLAHEGFHIWNGKKLHLAEEHDLLYWFREGFTDYYTSLLLLREGLLSIQKYVDRYNKVLREYLTSSARNKTNRQIAAEFWKDQEASQLPYRQGKVLATLWNMKIQLKSSGTQSLDDFIRTLFDYSKKEDTAISSDVMDIVFKSYAGDSLKRDITRFIENGETVTIPENGMGPCGQLQNVKTFVFNLGFDVEKTRKTFVIEGVSIDSAAYKAGLRDGQYIRNYDLDFGNVDHEVKLNVSDEQGDHLIKYFPRGAAVTLPQYKFDYERWNGNSSCRDWFGVP